MRAVPGEDPQPSASFKELDVYLLKVFLSVVRLEIVSLTHADHVCGGGPHMRENEADCSAREPCPRSSQSSGATVSRQC